LKSSIICIGNRFVTGDEAGILVFDRLCNRSNLPEEITVIEGGLAGLNLLPLLETGGRIVFVDAVSGFSTPGEVVIMGQDQILQSGKQLHFDHGAGLPYLLTVLPKVYDGELPEEILLVGLEGECTDRMIEDAADISVSVAMHGLQDLT